VPAESPLRVVILTTYFAPLIGGVESTAERLARYLLRAGHADTCVLTKRLSPERPDDERMDGLRVVRIGAYGDRSPSGKWRLIPTATRWLLAHREEYDVVACIDYRGIGLAGLLARGVTKRPVLFQAQTTGVLSAGNADQALQRLGIEPGTVVGRAAKSLVTRLYAGADAFACIAREIERETREAGVSGERIHFLPNPVDTDRFRPATDSERRALRAVYGVDDERVVVAFAGRLSREKGLSELLDAWRMLAERGWLHGPSEANRHVPLLVVAGPDMPGHAWNLGDSARAFVAQHRLDASVRFIGPLKDVAPLYRAADVAVVPSHFEALGLSALEALSCGTPVVASAVGGLLDFMQDEVNGALCPPRDAGAIAEKLGWLIRDADWRQGLARQARATVEGTYSERVVLARFVEVLKGLGSRPR
jgi:D-inositol-3-phosphate glycosyltransferase